MGSTSPPTPIRLAVLEADTPVPGCAAKFKDYTGVFTDLFRRAVAPAPVESELAISGYDVVNDPSSYPSLDEVDAVLITGSKHSAYLDEPWIVKLVEFTQKALNDGRVKVIGICFGHQIIGRALGVKVDKNVKGWEVSATELRLSEKGKEIFGLESLKIHQMHRDIIFSNPPGAISLAETDVCANQGLLIPGKCFTVQGHPEFTEEIVREILELRRGKIVPEEDYKSGMSRVADHHDGVKIAQAFLRFLRGKEVASS